MEKYLENAKRFIALLHPYIFSCREPYDYSKAIRVFMKTHTSYPTIRVSHGITRVVLIGSDFVVKINYDDYEVRKFGGGEEEIAFYEMAKSDGMEHLFAPITRFRYYGKTFYIMPRVYDIDDCREEEATDYMTEEERDWCDSHALHDLHSGNYGFENGNVVIFDYACYDKC